MYRWSTIVALFLIVGLPQSTRAQQPVVLSGTVVDSVTGRGLGGVVVSLGRATLQSATLTSVQTDDTGEYRLTVRTTGTYQLSFRRLGYREFVIRTVVVSESTTMAYKIFYRFHRCVFRAH